MDIQLISQLKLGAEERIEFLLDELEKESIRYQVDELNGHDRKDFIFGFNGVEFDLNKESEIIYIKLNFTLYLPDVDGVMLEGLEPIGSYVEVYDPAGVYLDEYIYIDSKEKSFGIQYWIEFLNNLTPKEYYRIESPGYEFISYINNTFALFQSRMFEEIYYFVEKCLSYIESGEGVNLTQVDSTYYVEALDYLVDLYIYLRDIKNIPIDDVVKWNIEKRIGVV